MDEYQIVNEESLSDHESDLSNECPLNNEISSKLSTAFAKATCIDIEFAVQLLNEHGWDIDEALAATYEAKEHAESVLTTKYTMKSIFYFLKRLFS
jgi:hypothetical protein